MEQEEVEEEEEKKETKPDPLHQLILHFSRTALTEKRSVRPPVVHKGWFTQNAVLSWLNIVLFSFNSSKLDTDHLYMAYADIMAKVRPNIKPQPWALIFGIVFSPKLK